jgi:hypothetical protein
VAFVGAVAALSLPGVHAARAEADLVPPAKQLFAFDASASPPRPAATASCGAAQAELSRSAHARRQAALARIAALVAAGPGGDAQALDGRGYAYPVQRDPSLEILRIQREAQRLQAGGAR